MNHVNSILLEGFISGKPGVVKEGGAKRCCFVVSSIRWDRWEEAKTETRIWIMLRGAKLVNGAIRNAKDGHKVRVVGRIANDGEDNGIYIEAEHVEYCAVLKDTEKRV
jgi:hypothetical protein